MRSKSATKRLFRARSWSLALFLAMVAIGCLLAACRALPTEVVELATATQVGTLTSQAIQTDPTQTINHELATATPVGTLTSQAIQTDPTQTIDRWIELFERDPYPWTTPLPPAEPTILDGTYTKVDPIEATPFPCVRCPDYKREGGVWKLNLDKGVYRIYHPITSWRSIASYTVSGDRLLIFNDPNCPKEVGIYHWTLEEGMLTLETIQDTCAINLRPKNLSYQPWLSCQPPNVEAAISDHWKKPLGCEND